MFRDLADNGTRVRGTGTPTTVTYETKSKPDRQGLWSSRRSRDDDWEELPVFRQATGMDETLFTIINGSLYNTEHLEGSGREWVGPMIRPDGFYKQIPVHITIW